MPMPTTPRFANAMARCGPQRKPFGIRFEQQATGLWLATWTFRLDEGSAAGEVPEAAEITGGVGTDSAFRGCPWCGARAFFRCGACGKLTCWDTRHATVTCACCGVTSTIGGQIQSVTT